MPSGSCVSEAGFRDEFVGELPDRLAARVSPDLWKLHWALMTPQRRENVVKLFEDQTTNLDEIVTLSRDFLGRVHTA